MKKNIVATLFFSFIVIINAFAFEGVIEQQVTSINEGVKTTNTLTWYIKGDNVKLVVNGIEGKTITLIPKTATNTLIVFSEDAKDADGKVVYAEVSASNVQNTIRSIATGEKKSSTYNGKESKTVDVNCDGIAYVVEYAPFININLKAYAGLIKDNIGLQALATLNEVGFPVSVKNNDQFVLKTLNIKETTVSDSEFNLSEANYIKYQ